MVVVDVVTLAVEIFATGIVIGTMSVKETGKETGTVIFVICAMVPRYFDVTLTESGVVEIELLILEIHALASAEAVRALPLETFVMQGTLLCETST